ncbi:Kelch repeat-containing protein [Sorangium sp. So ce1335]|uniref:Kelch repeat-containing protein n=1 Tax=Sorangium sp. So ce1335 TaxID=3133335 RepID=UPI003F6071CD
MRHRSAISGLLPACAALLISMPAAAQSWTFSSLSIARGSHGAAALPSGEVLVVGGYIDPSTWTARTVESYSASTGSWSVFGETQGDHYLNVHALPLHDGRLLVVSMEAPLETYDPASDTWTQWSDAWVFVSDTAVTQLADGDGFFVGGAMDLDDWDTTLRFDAETGALHTLAPLAQARRAPAATLLADGRVLVTGGVYFIWEDERFKELAGAEIYDPVTDTWTGAAPMPEARWRHDAALLPDGRVLVTGGVGRSSTAIYDPATDAWTAGPAMAGARWDHTMTTLPSGRVVVVGGGDAGASVELYDPATESFTALPSLSVGRSGHTTTYIPGKGLLVVGGGSAELYGLHQTPEGHACVITEECASGTCEGGLCVDGSGSSGGGAGGPGGPPVGGGCSLPLLGLDASYAGAACLLFAPGLFVRRRRRSSAGSQPPRPPR